MWLVLPMMTTVTAIVDDNDDYKNDDDDDDESISESLYARIRVFEREAKSEAMKIMREMRQSESQQAADMRRSGFIDRYAL